MKISVACLGGVCVIYCLLTYSVRASTIKKKRSFSDNLNSGIKLAGQILGIERAADVANLVANAFAPNTGHSTQRIDREHVSLSPGSSMDPLLQSNNGLLSQLLQIIGLDGGKIGALAVNGIIFIAQMVRESLAMAGTYFKQSIFDWRTIINYIVERVQEAQRNGTTNGAIGGGGGGGGGVVGGGVPLTTIIS